MSESPPVPSPEPVTPEKPGGFFQNLVDLYFAPREAFARIVPNPTFILPLLGHIVLSMVFTGIWLNGVSCGVYALMPGTKPISSIIAD